ncbi:tail fiber assembly protein [Candidatus Williamhamiltonella defendens]|uniref:tail fiber assembly protein n=1 Tax=Candidatus Williamhamiltonella defendens TaxID=138072 RepID=UPI00387E2D35
MKRKKDRFMHIAIKAIAPLQDALDLGVSTEQEIDTLHAWKTYRVALHRLDPKAREMARPEVPRG